ncbi:3-deoxy-D-manno-octulosonic-acid transferase [Anaerobiospirillum thomasii]|uniref:glycosyltransferase N-terminal domain-containing protein n=1 Tax=Anaerobiospirillum thomasii TaxID=179995 RepID=UPI000D968718|nr:glycosyltransferase N-terminal domain-containing protein [Anaerobiospirillum thomasii]SPT71267.1 3-deoxy-D-manno-octulosonic-acid transferase [Anaerobiospirillum thomasii]
MELFGFCPYRFKRSIWFHTVSVGEVIAARPLINNFVKRHPKLNIIVTTTTTTGALEAQKIKGITHIFAPLGQFSCSWYFYLKSKTNPIFLSWRQSCGQICLISATDIRSMSLCLMPECLRKPVLNMKDSSGWSKILLQEKISMVIAQTPDDAQRFERIGINKDRIFVANSLKYDLVPNDDLFKESYMFKKAHDNYLS